MIIKDTTYLAHYGVKGMRWGVRKDRSGSSSGSSRGSGGKVGSTPEQDLAVAYATMIGVAIAAKSIHGFFSSGEAQRKKEQGKNFVTLNRGANFNKKPELAKKNMKPDEIMASVVKPINPDFAKGSSGAKMNCRRATFAYEMRRRGMDVEATKTSIAKGQDALGLQNALTPGQLKRSRMLYVMKDREAANSWGQDKIPAPKDKNKSLYDSTFATLNKQPERSRGELAVGWEFGGGHSVSYEIIGGKAHIFDNQSGKVFTTPKALQDEFKINVGEAAFTRLDNRPLNEDFLRRWVKNAA